MAPCGFTFKHREGDSQYVLISAATCSRVSPRRMVIRGPSGEDWPRFRWKWCNHNERFTLWLKSVRAIINVLETVSRRED